MPIFTIENVPEFGTHQKVNKLWRNGKCLVNQFIEEVNQDVNLAHELLELYATLEDVANVKRVPPNQYKKLHLGKLKYAAFELKSKHLRLYLIHESGTGQILIIGGKKGTQDQDIERLEKIIKEYSSAR